MARPKKMSDKIVSLAFVYPPEEDKKLLAKESEFFAIINKFDKLPPWLRGRVVYLARDITETDDGFYIDLVNGFNISVLLDETLFIGRGENALYNYMEKKYPEEDNLVDDIGF